MPIPMMYLIAIPSIALAKLLTKAWPYMETFGQVRCCALPVLCLCRLLCPCLRRVVCRAC